MGATPVGAISRLPFEKLNMGFKKLMLYYLFN